MKKLLCKFLLKLEKVASTYAIHTLDCKCTKCNFEKNPKESVVKISVKIEDHLELRECLKRNFQCHLAVWPLLRGWCVASNFSIISSET